MWTASIVNKTWKNGLLTVELEYSDGERTFHDSMVSRSGQAADWVQAEVTRRLADLAGLDALAATIETGPVAPLPTRQAAQPDGLSEYAGVLRQFNAALSAARQGIVSDDAEIIHNLRQWLRDNFRPEHLELFA
jgi:hypothetical protein